MSPLESLLARADSVIVFINGLELSEPGVVLWKEARENVLAKSKSSKANVEKPGNQNSGDGFAHTGNRPDRLNQEHEFVPRLKVSSSHQYSGSTNLYLFITSLQTLATQLASSEKNPSMY